MGEARLEIKNLADEIELPADLCCNCGSTQGVGSVESELKLTRYFAMAGVEYTFRWGLPYCEECAPTATRNPVGPLHVALMIGLGTVALFLIAIIVQIAMDQSYFGGNDFWVSLAAASLFVGAFYATRRPHGSQTSYYQPIRVRKLRQKFTSGQVTGIVLGFTNGSYMQRFQSANTRLLAG